MQLIDHKRSPDEPEGGWLGPSGPGAWADLQELDRQQREQMKKLRRKENW